MNPSKKGSTIREKFDAYRFKDSKEKVFDLLICVTAPVTGIHPNLLPSKR